ncbi:MAG: peptidylprolyl isomerase [Pseudomonadota bacterium]|nr:peptidylprolyl isomerase [Pseudomonadota bacterium]
MSRFLLPLLVILTACEPPPPPIPGEVERVGEVLQIVNGQNVTQGMVDATLAQLPANVRDQVIAKGQLAQVKDQVVIGELLYQEAIKQKLHEKPETKQSLALSARNALANALLEDVVKQRTTDEAVKTWYNDHLVQFAKPQVKARHILVADKAEADKLLADVKGGADFSKIAAEKSTDKGSAKEGGDLGWFERGRMVPEFADAAFAGEKGAVVGPIASKYGFHIISIDDKREAIPVEEVADKIKSQLRNDVVEAYIEEIKKGATMTTPTAPAAGGATVSPAAVQTDAAPGAAPATPPAPAPH